MNRVVVPVRYPLSAGSKRALREACSVAAERDADIVVLHVDLYQNGRKVRRSTLRAAVETEVGPLPGAEYVIRSGYLFSETIREEIDAQDAEVVVIGRGRDALWRRVLSRATGRRSLAATLSESVDCSIIEVSA
ncbi:universal stress protein [Natronorarus salvus]|uniref:universal stress protein n=1 Tax=Natronorarus salvus TaxID=3117733 RepID=UPI002F261344